MLSNSAGSSGSGISNRPPGGNCGFLEMIAKVTTAWERSLALSHRHTVALRGHVSHDRGRRGSILEC